MKITANKFFCLSALALGLAVTTSCKQRDRMTGEVLTKSGKPKAGNSFKEVTSQLEGGGPVYVYLSSEAFLTNVSQKVEEWGGLLTKSANPQDASNLQATVRMLSRLVQTSGIENISGLGLSSVQNDYGAFRTKAVVHHYKDRGQGLVWNLTSKESHSLDSLNMLPTNTIYAFFTDLNAGLLNKTVEEEIQNSGIPALQKGYSQMIQQFTKATGLHWKDVIDSLVGEFGIVITGDESRKTRLPLPNGEFFEMPELAIAMAVKISNDLVFKHVETMVQENPQVIRVEKDGARSLTFKVPLPLPLNFSPTLSQTKEYLFFGTTPEIIQTILAVKEGGQKGLKTTSAWKQISSKIPEKGNQFIYVDRAMGELAGRVQAQALKSGAGRNAQIPGELLNSLIMSSNSFYGVAGKTEEGWVVVMNSTMNPSLLGALPIVAIGGIGAGLALPAMAKAKAQAQAQAQGRAQPPSGEEAKIMNKLRAIDSAKEVYAVENNKQAGTEVTEGDLAPYLGNESLAPVAGEQYFINPVGAPSQARMGKTVGSFQEGQVITGSNNNRGNRRRGAPPQQPAP